MGGQERQIKMDKSWRTGAFTNSTAFSRLKGCCKDFRAGSLGRLGACGPESREVAVGEGRELGYKMSWPTCSHMTMPLS